MEETYNRSWAPVRELSSPSWVCVLQKSLAITPCSIYTLQAPNYIDGKVQDCSSSISIALAMELLRYCTERWYNIPFIDWKRSRVTWYNRKTDLGVWNMYITDLVSLEIYNTYMLRVLTYQGIIRHRAVEWGFHGKRIKPNRVQSGSELEAIADLQGPMLLTMLTRD